jgi:membrane-associated phospholipid phosphatase
VTTIVAAGRRVLPRGWKDLARQVAIWFGFAIAYQFARGLAGHNPTKAFADGAKVIELEQRITTNVWELTFQNFAHSYSWLATAASWTYWNSEFTVVALSLLWVYMRRHDSFVRFRNVILLANVIGLFGYVLVPTAPPRMFTGLGFVDSHHEGLVQLAANPYAAMPSLHAADALLLGVMLAILVRRRIVKIFWLVWPAWVWFSVVATANHFWLDVVGGIVVAILAAAIVYGRPVVRAALGPLRA